MYNNSWFGHTAEHRVAALKGWRGRRRKKGGVAKQKVKHAAKSRSAAAKKAWRTRKAKKRGGPLISTRGFGMSPIIGMNPRRRRRVHRMDNAPRRRRRARHNNPIVYNARRRRARHDNPIIYSNARRRGRGRFRSNPVGGSLMQQTMSALPHIGVGAVSVITTALVPKMTAKVSTNTYVTLVGQLAWVFGGGYAVNKFTKNKYGLAWMVGGGSVILADLVHKYILGGILAGLGAYEAPQALGAYEMPHALGEAATGFAPAQGFESVSGFGDFGLADSEYRG